eukprot:6476482-Amphidinium_carterae.1
MHNLTSKGPHTPQVWVVGGCDFATYGMRILGVPVCMLTWGKKPSPVCHPCIEPISAAKWPRHAFDLEIPDPSACCTSQRGPA